MSVIDKLKNMNLDDDTTVSLSYSEGAEVFVHNETEIETALSETDVINTFSELVTTPGLHATSQYGLDIIGSLRSDGVLDDYERGSHSFSDYLTEALTDSFYDQQFIDYSTEKYDHKRGYTTLSTDVKVTAKNLFDSSPSLGSWVVTVQTENGKLTID
jgi:hypothetical protein